MRWILLVAKAISFYMSLESLGIIEKLKQNPQNFAKWIWGNSDKNINSSLKTNLQNKLEIWAVLIPVTTSIFLANATYKAFVN
jgi:phage tail sheath gpL-like